MQQLVFVPARQDKARANGGTQCFITEFATNIFPGFVFDGPKKLQ
jgi:hypothetical protein